MTQDGKQAVLMDLGLAQLADDVEGRLTRTRQFVGTLRYASPQQVLAVGVLDRRTDVYSLGATFWEVLALRPLFGATGQMPTPELMEKIQREEPALLSKFHPGLPRDLEAIVHKCLEKSPDLRYTNAHELVLDLRRFLAGNPVHARPVKALERSWKWVKRHPATAAIYMMAILVTVLGAVGGSMAWLYHRAVEASERAEIALINEQAAKASTELALRGEKKARHQADEAFLSEKAATFQTVKAQEESGHGLRGWHPARLQELASQTLRLGT